ncbi:hypothetical protein CO60_2583 [Mycobacterium tuberculosis]|nr:hypothetical protein CO60_2583 [Mycobacterium tuberculosis]
MLIFEQRVKAHSAVAARLLKWDSTILQEPNVNRPGESGDSLI